jgi:hypothetical protein
MNLSFLQRLRAKILHSKICFEILGVLQQSLYKWVVGATIAQQWTEFLQMNVGIWVCIWEYFMATSFWMNRILAMNMGMWMSCLSLMGVFYGYPLGWTEILAMDKCGCYGCILWVPFWMDRNFAMNECGCYGCILWVPFWMDRVFAMNECGCYGRILWVPFWMDRVFAMNECGCYGCILWVPFWMDREFLQ